MLTANNNMELKELYLKLEGAYSNDNLNRITGKLIELYKNKNFSKIREIANKISKYTLIEEEKDSKCFSKLIILYHPDRGEAIKKEIENFYLKHDYESLNKYSHIFLLDNLDSIPVNRLVDEDIDYHPEYMWDEVLEDDPDYFNEVDDDEFYSEYYERSLFNAVKLRVYGDLKKELPSYYLEDFDDIELSACGIEILDGIEYCKHAVTLDLSYNEITDISQLWNLDRLEELFLTDNQIGYIDTLSNLLKLRVVDISGNEIDDISPLFELEKLEFVNVIGNKIPLNQIAELKRRGILVMH